jgi:CRISPR/Cas system-associated exonuclease Cas4 (RecB family)
LYGLCSRKLWFASKTTEVIRTEEEEKAIERGSKLHSLIEWGIQSAHPDWALKTEQRFSRELPSPIYGVSRVQVTADLVNAKKVIEIKPRYSMRAYIQTLVQKFVLPDHAFEIYGYAKKEFFPIKADFKMAQVYVGRILTAIHFLPPRVPNADLTKWPCLDCQFKDKCWKEEQGDWAVFKIQSQYAVDEVMRA